MASEFGKIPRLIVDEDKNIWLLYAIRPDTILEKGVIVTGTYKGYKCDYHFSKYNEYSGDIREL